MGFVPEDRAQSRTYHKGFGGGALSLNGKSVTIDGTVSARGGKGGDAVVTDGPYAEAKEVLGGFFLIEAADLDDAIKWASKIPAAWDGGKVELRPVVPLQK